LHRGRAQQMGSAEATARTGRWGLDRVIVAVALLGLVLGALVVAWRKAAQRERATADALSQAHMTILREQHARVEVERKWHVAVTARQLARSAAQATGAPDERLAREVERLRRENHELAQEVRRLERELQSRPSARE